MILDEDDDDDGDATALLLLFVLLLNKVESKPSYGQKKRTGKTLPES